MQLTGAEIFHFRRMLRLETYKNFSNSGGDFELLVRRRQSNCLHTRLSLDSIRLSGGDTSPLGPLLREFAVEGVDVMVGPDFFCNRTPPPFSPAYRKAHTAVDKLLYDSYLAGHGIILPTSSLEKIVPPGALHFSRLGLTLKKGKKSGRVTSNYTYSVLGHAVGSLNSDHVIELSKEKYGEIYLTTLFDLVDMVTHQVTLAIESGRSATDVVLWSMDLKGAFSLLWFRPDKVGLLALPMMNDLTFFPIAGNFGLGLFPFAFNIISRFLRIVVVISYVVKPACMSTTSMVVVSGKISNMI